MIYQLVAWYRRTRMLNANPAYMVIKAGSNDQVVNLCRQLHEEGCTVVAQPATCDRIQPFDGDIVSDSIATVTITTKGGQQVRVSSADTACGHLHQGSLGLLAVYHVRHFWHFGRQPSNAHTLRDAIRRHAVQQAIPVV